MNKLVSVLTLAAFAAISFSAQAASHAGGAPMKASAPAAKASGAAAKASAPAAKASAAAKK